MAENKQTKAPVDGGEPVNYVDLKNRRHEYLFRPPHFVEKFFAQRLEDQRDMIMIYLAFNITVTVIPSAILLFLLPESTLLGVLYVGLNYAAYAQRFCLMLHYSEHRRLFNRNCSSLWNYYIPYILAPFYGIPSGLYYMHHCVMHHQENNVFPWDITSTEPFQRDNILSYLQYLAQWVIGTWVLLPYYLFKRKQWKLFQHIVLCLVCFAFAINILSRINSSATFWVFTLPLIMSSLLFSFGNYSQHIFLDPEKRDAYGVTYNCINADDNTRSFNDGYHVTHHINSRIHWTQLPHRFLSKIDNYADADSVTFHTVGFFDVGVLVFTGQWEKLASYYTPLNDKQKKRSKEEIIQLLKSRCTPIKC